MNSVRRSALLGLVCICTLAVETRPVSADPRFDVNDVSFLWPPPANKDDVALLLSADEKSGDATSQLWPADVFDAVMKKVATVTVTNSAGTEDRIDFRPFDAEFAKLQTWKVV
ncbi:MAG: hypothetical protein KGO05_01185, partial [Chloroflexota bacterium]|nr:hypothetical protein [Chloroflexota bacterium]